MRLRNVLASLMLLCLGALGAQAQSRAAMSSLSDDQKSQFQAFSVAFYNLENLFDTINNNGKYDEEFSPSGARAWNSTKYWQKISNLARAIQSMASQSKVTPQGPAVIGVCEIENESVLRDLVADPQIKSRNYQVIHHDSPDRRGVDVGLLYNPRFFRPLNVTNHTLTTIPYPTRDQMCVVGVMGGDTIGFVVNHWPSRLGGEKKSSPNREAAAALSKQICDSVWALHPNYAMIVMGDLNDDPDNKSVKTVLGAKKKQDQVDSEHGFFNPFWALLADKGVGTLGYRGSWNLFDQIIVSGNLLEKYTGSNRLHFLREYVCNFKFMQQEDNGAPLRTYSGGVFLNGYSDHYPTQIILVKEI